MVLDSMWTYTRGTNVNAETFEKHVDNTYICGWVAKHVRIVVSVRMISRCIHLYIVSWLISGWFVNIFVIGYVCLCVYICIYIWTYVCLEQWEAFLASSMQTWMQHHSIFCTPFMEVRKCYEVRVKIRIKHGTALAWWSRWASPNI